MKSDQGFSTVPPSTLCSHKDTSLSKRQLYCLGKSLLVPPETQTDPLSVTFEEPLITYRHVDHEVIAPASGGQMVKEG